MRMASERGGSKGGIPVSLQDVSSSASRELLHHESGAAARDMGDDGGAAMNLWHQSEVAREGQLYLLPFAQPEIFRFDEHAVGSEILGLENSALSPRHHHIDGGPCSVAGVQAPPHPFG